MPVPSSVQSLAAKCLYESLNTDVMLRIARLVEPDYDLHARMGMSQNLSLQPMEAARQIVRDMADDNQLLPFAEALLRVDQEGLMGRPYPIQHLRRLIKALSDLGYQYDAASNLFFENPKVKRSPDWGRLRLDADYHLALLRFDIVANTKLVKQHGPDAVRQVYHELRQRALAAVEKRQGRFWIWEGDGALAAFYFGHRGNLAVLAAMEILEELWWFNRTANPLGQDLQLRMAVHAGHIRYTPQEAELKKQETVQLVMDQESKTPVGHVSVSPAVEGTLDRHLAGLLSRVRGGASQFQVEVEA